MNNKPWTERELARLRTIDLEELEQALAGSPTAGVICVSCGCTDTQPCLEGCWWTYTNPEQGIGLCSSCAWIPLAQLELRIQAALNYRALRSAVER